MTITKKLFIVANWKCNKTVGEAESWIKEIGNWKLEIGDLQNLEIILCAPFTLLYPLKTLITNYKLPITLGAQDISPFPDGAYTGEISARMLKDLGVEYVMIGHSERRKYFAETDQILTNKVRESLEQNLVPIFCVNDAQTPIPDGVKILLYEPSFAIGSGKAGDPNEVNEIAKKLKERLGENGIVLYGGSVNSENMSLFLNLEYIDGIGVGSASLDPQKFLEIVKNAS